MKKTFLKRDPRQMNQDEFLTTFAGVYENSPWIVEQLWQQQATGLPGDVEQFAQMLAAIVDGSTEDRRVELIRAHPDLAGRAALAGALTARSRGEQASAGLDQCTAEELARFQDLNERYNARFGFPFVMAVRGANRQRIFDGFAERIGNDRKTEMARALTEIHKIARLRLEEIARDG